MVDLRAEVVGSESRMRDSWPIRAERWMSVSVRCDDVVCDRRVVWTHLLEYLVQLLFCPLFLFGWLWVDV